MMFVKHYTVNEEHIDVQGIMDGLFYPFYMEDCRHDFVNNVLNFSIDDNARNGINIVLSEYTIKFLRSLKKGDQFDVTCEIEKDTVTNTSFIIKQTIKIGNRKYTEGVFTGTCVKSSGGRPFLPEELIRAIEINTTSLGE
ncbi:MAG: thioesterase family protein [Christensenellaceae bacterium]